MDSKPLYYKNSIAQFFKYYFLLSTQIINVIRNPRDVAVSTLNHWRILENYSGTFEQLCDVILENNGTHFGPYFRHVLSYWEQRNSARNLLIVTYEDMQRDLESVVRKVASFLEIGISEVDVCLLYTSPSPRDRG